MYLIILIYLAAHNFFNPLGAISLLYILMKYSPNIDVLFKFIKILVICSAFVFLANLLAFPNTVFGEGKEEFDMSRGFVRLGVSMIELVVFYMFYSISQYQSSKKKKWIFGSILTGVLVVFSLTRQVILLAFAFSFLIILQKANIWKKVLVVWNICNFRIVDNSY